MNIVSYLHKRKKLIDRALLSSLPRGSEYTRPLYEAMKYSLTSGGKRIRPIFVLAACEAVSGKYKGSIPLAVAIEMIHTYTLIHDDLPSMDDDDHRRGKLTCHKKFGEDIAILAGDNLNTLAFEIIARKYAKKAAVLISEIADLIGINGVVGGQVADLRSANRKVTRDELEFISIKKTACLFIASIKCGAVIGGASRKIINALSRFALHVGLAFQIIDDILDYGSEDKISYPAVLGLKQAKSEAQRHLDLALSALPKQEDFDVLREMALLLAKREK